MDAANPVISVETKKKELVGAYKNGGREWSPAGNRPVQGARLHRSRPGQIQILGVCDVAANTGWVAVMDWNIDMYTNRNTLWWKYFGWCTYCSFWQSQGCGSARRQEEGHRTAGGCTDGAV
jgi:hypothetical protein